MTCQMASRNCEYCGKEVKPFEIQWLGRAKWFSGTCPCVAERYKQEEEATERYNKQRKLENLFKQSRLGERFKNSTFDKYTPTDKTKPFSDLLINFCNDFKNKKNQSILMSSHPGTGKTLLASCVVNKLVSKGISSIFIIVPDLLGQIRATYNRSNNETEDSIMAGLNECELLVMDDIGAENTTDWATEKLFNIINNRYINCKSTIFTTNCSLGELKSKLGDRTFSRIYEMTEGNRLDMNGIEDFRLKRGAK